MKKNLLSKVLLLSALALLKPYIDNGSLIANSPVQASQTISNIPVFYSNLALVTIDSY